MFLRGESDGTTLAQFTLFMNDKIILVIDDEFDVIDQVLSFLSDTFPDYTALNAPNGKIGWELIKEKRPQLVLTDWDMPELNGIRIAQLVKSNDQLKDIPVILMTGRHTSSHDLRYALGAGTVDYLRKPLDMIELEARVNMALTVYRAQKEIQEQHETIQHLLKQDKLRLEEELQAKNRKLSASAILDVEKNQLFKEIKQAIEVVSPLLKDHPKEHKKLQNLRSSVKNQFRLDNSWDDFKLHFEEVHPHFFQKVAEIKPGLSLQDTKLLAYLKLGMENKEIASVFNISPSSARTAVYRLKKKFDIAESEDFRTFVFSLR